MSDQQQETLFIDKRELRQDITYWKQMGPDADVSGSFTFEAPIVIKGRWEEKAENKTDGEMRTFFSRAKVFTDRKVFVEDYLAPGDQTSVADPQQLTDCAWQVRMTSRMTDLANLRVELCAFL